MKDAAPWMPFFGRDFYADENVMLMTLEQEGAYMRLLWHCWQEGSLPNEQKRLAAIADRCEVQRFTETIWPAVAPCFTKRPDGRLIQKRVEQERAIKDEIREKRSEAGKLGNAKRWGEYRKSEEVPEIRHRKISEAPDHEKINLTESPKNSSQMNRICDNLRSQNIANTTPSESESESYPPTPPFF
jgi:uncharacterized protein YdaU (DUF1376 family)